MLQKISHSTSWHARSLIASACMALAGCGSYDGTSSSSAAAANTTSTDSASSNQVTDATAADVTVAALRARSPSTSSNASSATTTSPTSTNAATLNSVDLIISDQTRKSEVQWHPNYQKPDGSRWTWEAQTFLGSIASIKVLDNLAISNGYASNFYDRVNTIIPGIHTAEGEGNASTNTQVLKRNLTSYVLYGSTGKWVKVSGPTRPTGQIDRFSQWGVRYGAQDELPADSLIRQRQYDAMTTAVRPVAPYESEAWDVGYPANMKDVVAWFITFEAKLDLINPNGPDDRDRAVYVTNAWTDFGDSVGQSNGMPRYLGGGAPGHALDGGLSRLKKITRDWQPFNLISMVSYRQSTLASPWAFPEWVTPNPAAMTPYVLTEAQVRANPPPLK